MHFEPGGASPFDDGAMVGADAQSARGRMHRPRRRGGCWGRRGAPPTRAEGVVQSWSALISDGRVTRQREATKQTTTDNEADDNEADDNEADDNEADDNEADDNERRRRRRPQNQRGVASTKLMSASYLGASARGCD
jgi:hypothetical protein